ncbi:hypothetical protein DFH08DRAFT_801959 [Mycena albidolilacea]|uniref:Uncharacterized protein n=1 Tax=Mycena albidolilacea TaxID=1033008 RepID=A0AAD7AGD7_9AGAR|nr:hypothetical protein DFH08DRAFT_801959 [Mycena albidolilacea]
MLGTAAAKPSSLAFANHSSYPTSRKGYQSKVPNTNIPQESMGWYPAPAFLRVVTFRICLRRHKGSMLVQAMEPQPFTNFRSLMVISFAFHLPARWATQITQFESSLAFQLTFNAGAFDMVNMHIPCRMNVGGHRPQRLACVPSRVSRPSQVLASATIIVTLLLRLS